MRRNSDEFEGNVAKVILTISARNLRDIDLESVSDPFAVVSAMTLGPVTTKKWKELGRTEVINNCLNPDWATKIHMCYTFEEQQKLLIEVYDWEKAGKTTRLGGATLLLHEIVGAKYNRVTVPLTDEGKRYGTLTVTAEEVKSGRQESVYFMCRLQLAFRTRYREQNLNPKWKPFEVNIDQLSYGDKNREFLIECYDWDADGNHDLVGSCRTTVNRLISGQDDMLPLIHEKKARKSRKYIDSGQLHFHKVYCWLDFTFLDFVQGGTELDFTLAVDFSSSNLPLDDVSSLHRLEPGSANQYETAITAISEICQFYNLSKIFNGFGFGARLPHSDKTLYNFPLNVTTGEPRCEGVDGLLRAYRTALRYVVLSGPADFAPTIKLSIHPDKLTKDTPDSLLKELNPYPQMEASNLPLSIIIIGVGYDSFEEMKVLDSDNQLLSSHGRYAKRDIVQFVQLRNFLPPHRQLSEEELTEARRMLAKEVLQEIPMQLTSYMKSRGIYPLSYTKEHQQQAMSSSPRGLSHHQQFERKNQSIPRFNPHPPQPLHQVHGYIAQPAVNSAPPTYRTPAFSSSPSRVRRRLPQAPNEPFSQMHIY